MLDGPFCLREGPDIYRELTIQFYLLDKSFVVGEGNEGSGSTHKSGKIREKHLGDHHLLASADLTSFNFHSSSESANLNLPLVSSHTQTCPLSIALLFSFLSPKHMKKCLGRYKPFDPEKGKERERVKGGGGKRVGVVKKGLGFVPKYPIVLIPGLGGSVLEVWEGKSEWIRLVLCFLFIFIFILSRPHFQCRDRLWLDPFKIGKIAAAQRLKESRSSNSNIVKSQTWGPEEEVQLNYYTRQMTMNNADLAVSEGRKGGKALEEQRRWIRFVFF